MITAILIAGILLIFLIGFIGVYRQHAEVIGNIDFASKYRIKFIEFSNKYFENRQSGNYPGGLDGELYVWLTMNVNKIQSNTGSFGIMAYKPAFQNYMINNYQIIINTIPKFREGKIESFDVNSVDDSLLRYIGHLTEFSQTTLRNLKNPVIWFREGIKEIISIPLLILSWFGIFGKGILNRILDSILYKVFTGIIALVTFVSGIVTIIVGYDETKEFIFRLFDK